MKTIIAILAILLVFSLVLLSIKGTCDVERLTANEYEYIIEGLHEDIQNCIDSIETLNQEVLYWRERMFR